MRLGSGTFAACCVVIEVLGVALFLRGFFPAPVRSSSRTEHQAEPPAPEPSAGTDPSPAVSAPRAPLSPEDPPYEPRLSDFSRIPSALLFSSGPHTQEASFCIAQLCGPHHCQPHFALLPRGGKESSPHPGARLSRRLLIQSHPPPPSLDRPARHSLF